MNCCKKKTYPPVISRDLLLVRMRVIIEVLKVNNISHLELSKYINITSLHLYIILYPMNGRLLDRKSPYYYNRLFNRIDYVLNHPELYKELFKS